MLPSALSSRAFSVGHSYLALLCCHPHIGHCAQPSFIPSSGPLVWKEVHSELLCFPRGEESASKFGCGLLQTKYLRKPKGERFVFAHDFRGFQSGCCFSCLVPVTQPDHVTAEAAHLCSQEVWGKGCSERRRALQGHACSHLFLHPARHYFLVAQIRLRNSPWIRLAFPNLGMSPQCHLLESVLR